MEKCSASMTGKRYRTQNRPPIHEQLHNNGQTQKNTLSKSTDKWWKNIELKTAKKRARERERNAANKRENTFTPNSLTINYIGERAIILTVIESLCANNIMWMKIYICALLLDENGVWPKWRATLLHASLDKYLLMRKRRRLANRFCARPSSRARVWCRRLMKQG